MRAVKTCLIAHDESSEDLLIPHEGNKGLPIVPESNECLPIAPESIKDFPIAHKASKGFLIAHEGNKSHSPKDQVEVKQEPTMCGFCDMSFITEAGLTEHQQTHAGNQESASDISLSSSSRHNSLHQIGSGEYSVCDKMFTNPSKHLNHRVVHSLNVMKCTICNKVFQTMDDLQRHKLFHYTANRFSRDVCKEALKTRVSLLSHQTTSHAVNNNQKEKYVCSYCNKPLCNHQSLIEHVRAHTNEKPFPCNKCGKAFNRQRNLRRHMTIHTRNKAYSCMKCGTSFRSYYFLSKHTLIHKDRPYSCDICKKMYATKSNLSKHSRRHEKETLVCDECNKKFKTRLELKKHKSSHKTVQQRHICDTCNKSYKRASHLKKHKLSHRGTCQKSHVCRFCQESFKKITQLNLHLKTHAKARSRISSVPNVASRETLENKYNCGICSNSFETFYRMRKHKQMHKDRAFMCDVCEETFLVGAELRNHKQSECFDPYVCEVCNKSFNTKCTLQSHTIVHVSERPYMCSVCHKSFRTTKQLKQHLLVHTGRKPHVCQICDKGFAEIQNLRRHQQICSNGCNIKSGSLTPRVIQPIESTQATIGTENLNSHDVHVQVVEPSTSSVCRDVIYSKENQLTRHTLCTAESSDRDLRMCRPVEGNTISDAMDCHNKSADVQPSTNNEKLAVDNDGTVLTDSDGAFRLPNQGGEVHVEMSCTEVFEFPENFSREREPPLSKETSSKGKSSSQDVPLSGHHLLPESKTFQLLLEKLVLYICDVCEKSFHSQDLLDQHTINHTCSNNTIGKIWRNERNGTWKLGNFTCEVCDRFFTWKSQFNNHMKSHSNERPHKCDRCAKAYKVKRSLMLHQISCRKINQTQNARKEINNLVKREVCYKGFPLHKHNIHDIHVSQGRMGSRNKLKCRHCNRIFRFPYERERHENTHSKEKRYKCDCGKAFKQKYEVSRHRAKYHAKEMPLQSSKGKVNQTFHKHQLQSHQISSCSKTTNETISEPTQASEDSTRVINEHDMIHHQTSCGKSTGPHVHSMRSERKLDHKCEDCGECFKRKIYLTDHMASHSNERPYKCVRCGKTYKYKRAMFRHQASCGQNMRNERNGTWKFGNYTCEVCGRFFTWKSQFNNHMKSHSNERPHKCDRCAKAYKVKRSLMLHQISCRKINQTQNDRKEIHNLVKREVCYKGFPLHKHNIHDIHVSQGRMGSRNKLKCRHCNRIFRFPYERERHENTHSKEKRYKCDCGKAFKQKYEVSRHRAKYHAKEMPLQSSKGKVNQTFHKHQLQSHQISLCSKTTNETISKPTQASEDSTRVINEHDMIHHQTSCGKTTGPHVHSMRNETKLDHKCEDCGECFKRKIYLTGHMASHSNERPYKCVRCGKTYKYKRAMFRHQASCGQNRRNERNGTWKFGNYTCEVCGRFFTWKSQFNNHMKSHSNERPHKCDRCAKAYKVKRSLMLHQISCRKINQTQNDTKEIHNLVKREVCYKGFPLHKHNIHDIHVSQGRMGSRNKLKCRHCNRIFRFPYERERHENTHSKEKRYKCECGKAFKQKYQLLRHRNRHHTNMETTNDSEITTGVIAESNKASQDSEQCKDEAATSAGKEQPKNQPTKKKGYPCNLWDHVSVSKSCLVQHKQIHTNSRPFKCNKCDGDFSLGHTLQLHKQNLHGMLPETIRSRTTLLCRYCHKVCQYQHELERHENTCSHSTEKLYMCECGRALREDYQLSGHQARHHANLKTNKELLIGLIPDESSAADNVWQTPQSNAQLDQMNTQENLSCVSPSVTLQPSQTGNELTVGVIPLISHSSEGPYACEAYGKAYKYKRQVTADQTYYCKKSSGLQDPGRKLFKCGVCDEVSTSKNNLVKHMKSHTQEQLCSQGKMTKLKSFICEVCTKVFPFQSTLAYHMKCHSNIKAYECGQCGRTYKQKYHLTAHQKTYCEKTTGKTKTT